MDEQAQLRLRQARVLVLGAGGVAQACLAYLAEAGAGTLVIVDPAHVSESDLIEEVLLTPEDVGQPKARAVAKRLSQMNADVEIIVRAERFDAHNAERFICDVDIVVDAMGDWQDKLVASDVCMQRVKTLVHAGVRAYEFHVYTMIPGRSACLRCLFAGIGIEDVVSASEGPRGVLGPVCGMAGAFQAIEVIKSAAGIGTTPGSYLIRFDALRRYVEQVMELGPRLDCPDCGRDFK